MGRPGCARERLSVRSLSSGVGLAYVRFALATLRCETGPSLSLSGALREHVWCLRWDRSPPTSRQVCALATQPGNPGPRPPPHNRRRSITSTPDPRVGLAGSLARPRSRPSPRGSQSPFAVRRPITACATSVSIGGCGGRRRTREAFHSQGRAPPRPGRACVHSTLSPRTMCLVRGPCCRQF